GRPAPARGAWRSVRSQERAPHVAVGAAASIAGSPASSGDAASASGVQASLIGAAPSTPASTGGDASQAMARTSAVPSVPTRCVTEPPMRHPDEPRRAGQWERRLRFVIAILLAACDPGPDPSDAGHEADAGADAAMTTEDGAMPTTDAGADAGVETDAGAAARTCLAPDGADPTGTDVLEDGARATVT